MSTWSEKYLKLQVKAKKGVRRKLEKCVFLTFLEKCSHFPPIQPLFFIWIFLDWGLAAVPDVQPTRNVWLVVGLAFISNCSKRSLRLFFHSVYPSRVFFPRCLHFAKPVGTFTHRGIPAKDARWKWGLPTQALWGASSKKGKCDPHWGNVQQNSIPRDSLGNTPCDSRGGGSNALVHFVLFCFVFHLCCFSVIPCFVYFFLPCFCVP